LAVDLGAGVVEVVLAGDLRAARGQHPAQRVADRGPPGAAQVQRAGRVGGDELEVHVAPGQLVAGAVARARGEDLPDDRALGVGGQAQVDEPGPGDLGAGDAVAGGQLLGQPGRELARVHAGLLGGPQRDVGRVVAVVGVAGTLDTGVGRQCGDVQVASEQHVPRDVTDQVGEHVGIHHPDSTEGPPAPSCRYPHPDRRRCGA